MIWQAPVIGEFSFRFYGFRENGNGKCERLLRRADVLGLVTVVAEIPLFETGLRDNQTLQPLGEALRENYRHGDAVVCWGQFPQGLPFYSGSVISATNRPYFGGMDLTQVPFEFPGNRERFGDLLLPDENSLAQLLDSDRRVWLVSFGDEAEKIQQARGAAPLHLVAIVGRWELFVSR